MKNEKQNEIDFFNNRQPGKSISELEGGTIIKVLRLNNDKYGYYQKNVNKIYLVTEDMSHGVFMINIDTGKFWYNESLMREDIDYQILREK